MTSALRSYPWEAALLDTVSGSLSVVSIIMIALLCGGWFLVAPWGFAAAITMFAVGFLRSRSQGAIWLKASMLCLPLLVYCLSGRSVRIAACAMAALTVFPCAAGLWAGRHRQA